MEWEVGSMGVLRKILLVAGLLPLLSIFGIRSAEGKVVAITFDDGPSGHFTADLLDGLKERNVNATFFLCGYRVDQFPTLTKRIATEGHEIGTHSDAHKFFSEMNPAELCADLTASMEKLEKVTGKRPALLRPPGGIFDREALQKTTCADLPIILWSVDPEDWCCSCSRTIRDRVLSKVENGDIILLHDMSDSSVQAALQIIDHLQKEGYTFVTVSKLAERSGTELLGGKVYSCF